MMLLVDLLQGIRAEIHIELEKDRCQLRQEVRKSVKQILQKVTNNDFPKLSGAYDTPLRPRNLAGGS